MPAILVGDNLGKKFFFLLQDIVLSSFTRMVSYLRTNLQFQKVQSPSEAEVIGYC